MEIRLIIMRTGRMGAGGTEEVVFTEEKEPATDFCKRGYKAVFDKTIKADLPDEFPINRTLVAEE